MPSGRFFPYYILLFAPDSPCLRANLPGLMRRRLQLRDEIQQTHTTAQPCSASCRLSTQPGLWAQTFDYKMSQSSLFTSRLSLKGKEPRPQVFSGMVATFHSEFQSFCSDVDIDHRHDIMLLAVHAEISINR